MEGAILVTKLFSSQVLVAAHWSTSLAWPNIASSRPGGEAGDYDLQQLQPQQPRPTRSHQGKSSGQTDEMTAIKESLLETATGTNSTPKALLDNDNDRTWSQTSNGNTRPDCTLVAENLGGSYSLKGLSHQIRFA
jgi:hypothetical protein